MCGLYGNPTEGWHKVQSRRGECSVFFPQIPEHKEHVVKVSESGDMLHYALYLAPFDAEGICLLLVATYPFVFEKGQEGLGLQGLVRGIVGQHPDNQLLFARPATIEGHSGIDFLVRGGVSYFRGQAVIIGHQMFLLAFEGRSQIVNEEGFQTFFQTFKIHSLGVLQHKELSEPRRR
jgi:hypothetical protein